MFEKPKKPEAPWQPNYEAKVERRYIYAFVESLQEDEDDNEWLKERSEHRHGGYKGPKKDIGEVSLAWLITQVPLGIKPEQIKIEFDYNASSMAYEDHYIKFYYEEKIPARKAEFKVDQKKYEADLKQYEKDLAAYQEQCRLDKIKNMEAELSKLKKK